MKLALLTLRWPLAECSYRAADIFMNEKGSDLCRAATLNSLSFELGF